MNNNLGCAHQSELMCIHSNMNGDTDSLKCQGTYLYQLTIKMFNMQESRWHEIDKVLIEKMKELNLKPSSFTEEDKYKCLAATAQLIESLKLSSEKEREGDAIELCTPLSAEEAEILEQTSENDWLHLRENKHTLEGKIDLQQRVKLLLRDFNQFARREKGDSSEEGKFERTLTIEKAGKKACKHCNKKYTATTSLHQHLKSESGVRFFFCSRCTNGDKKSSFTRKNSLYYHILKENDIPRYICYDCNKQHNHTHHHKCHAKQHTGSQSYLCTIVNCQEIIQSRLAYRIHLVSMHCMDYQSNGAFIDLSHEDARDLLQRLCAKAKKASQGKKRKLSGSLSERRESFSSQQATLKPETAIKPDNIYYFDQLDENKEPKVEIVTTQEVHSPEILWTDHNNVSDVRTSIDNDRYIYYANQRDLTKQPFQDINNVPSTGSQMQISNTLSRFDQLLHAAEIILLNTNV